MLERILLSGVRVACAVSVLFALSLLAPALALAQLAVVVAQQTDAAADRDAAAITAVIERYFAALNAGEADTAIGLWLPGSPGRAFVERTLRPMLKDSSPEWTNVRLSQITVEGAKAHAHLEFELAYRPAGGPPPSPTEQTVVRRARSRATDVVTLARANGAWRIESEIPESQDLANRLLSAPDDAARDRLIAAEGERINWGVLQALLGIGGEANMRGRFDDGIRATSLAVRLTEAKMVEAADTPPAAIAESYLLHGLSDLAFAYTYKPTPDFPKAIALLTRAQEIQGRNGDELGQGTTLQARGNAYYAGGDYTRALDDYQHALALHTKANDLDGAARSRLGVGNVQFLFGQFDLAMDAYQQAQQAFEEMRNTEPQPRSLQGLARVYGALGDYTRSRELFTRALALLTAASRKSEQAGTLLDLGHVCFQQGKLDDAEAQLNQALALDNELKDADGQGRALFALGLLQMVRARYDEAIQTFTRSADAFTRFNSRDGLGQAVLARAAARFEEHDLPGALADYTTSVRTFQDAKNLEGVSRANVGLAMTYVARQEAKPALDTAEAAWKAAEQAGAPEIGWQARYESGRALLLSGESDRAREHFETSIATLERAQLEAGGDIDSSPPARRAAPYVALVEWFVAHGDATQALLLADSAKRRLLQDLVMPYRFRLTRGLTVEQQREERRLFSQRVSLAKQMRHERQRATPDAANLAQLETQLASARTAASDWDRGLLRDHFELAFQRGDADFKSATDLEQLAQQLTDTSALVHFVVGDTQTTVLVATRKALVATREAATEAEVPIPPSASVPTPTPVPAPTLEVHAYTIDLTRGQVAEQVALFNDAIERRLDTTSNAARVLFDRLLGPARDQLADRTQLVIVPDDALWMLPFQALQPADDRRLDQGVAVTLLPSVAAWVLRPSPVQAAVATTEQTRGDGPVTLLASGTISDLTPLQSTLTLLPPQAQTPAQTPTPAETLSAWQLFEHPLQADLLVLIDRTAADERIRLDQGRLGAMGLAWALQIAGVPRVAIARWPLAKDEREHVMQDVAGFAAGRPSMSGTPTSSPVHESAAFMLIGPPQPVPAEPRVQGQPAQQ